MKSQMFSFDIDKKELEELQNTLKKAVELPRRRITQAVRKAMKIPLVQAKYILRSVPDNYKMKFKDGNTWTKEDIIKNLYLKAEKSYSKDKKMYRLAIRDWRVDKYSNFVEFGYTNPRTGAVHQPTHFMRNSLDDTAPELSKEIINNIIKSLEELGLIE
jgi:hypothetical protein